MYRQTRRAGPAMARPSQQNGTSQMTQRLTSMRVTPVEGATSTHNLLSMTHGPKGGGRETANSHPHAPPMNSAQKAREQLQRDQRAGLPRLGSGRSTTSPSPPRPEGLPGRAIFSDATARDAGTKRGLPLPAHQNPQAGSSTVHLKATPFPLPIATLTERASNTQERAVSLAVKRAQQSEVHLRDLSEQLRHLPPNGPQRIAVVEKMRQATTAKNAASQNAALAQRKANFANHGR